MDSPIIATAAAALPVLLVWAGAVDIFTSAIPNKAVLLLAASFGLFAIMAGMPFTAIAAHIACGGAVLAFGFLFFSSGLIGGGDAKLLAAASLWFGFGNLLPFIAATALAGGVLSLVTLAVSVAKAQLAPGGTPPRTIPYGAAIAAGALGILPDWIASL